MSSLMPSVSIFVTGRKPGGEGGGVCSAAGPAGRGAEVEEARECNLEGVADDEEVDEMEPRVCDRLMRFGGGAMSRAAFRALF